MEKEGRRWDTVVEAGGVDPLWLGDTDISLVTPAGWANARQTSALPLWLQAPLEYHRLIDLPDRRALYAQLNMVTDIRDQSLTRFAERIAQQAKATNPRALVLDLRLNRDGNQDLRFGLIRALVRAEDDDTELFVLTARGVFSATQAVLDDLDRYSKAIIIGEPAGSKPNSFGDSYRNVLPNSRLTVRTSTQWHQIDNNKKRSWTPVDVAVPYRFADYAAGRDAVLEAALGYTRRPTLDSLVLAAATEGGVEAVRKSFAAYRAQPATRYQNLERALAIAGNRLYTQKYGKESVALLEDGVAVLPASAELFVVLAQLADFTGQPDIARRAAIRTLELEPNDRTARSILEKLNAAK